MPETAERTGPLHTRSGDAAWRVQGHRKRSLAHGALGQPHTALGGVLDAVSLRTALTSLKGSSSPSPWQARIASITPLAPR